MAFVDSQWGKATPNATLNNPPPPSDYSDSGWGKVTAVLSGPTPPPTGGGFVDSGWGKILATLVAPLPSDGYTDSNWSDPARAAVGIVVVPFDPIVNVEPGTPVELTATVASNQPVLRPALEKSWQQPVPIVFAGSSTTFGQGASTPTMNYVALTTAALQSAYPSGLGTESAVLASTSSTFTARTQVGIHGYNSGEGGTTSANFLPVGERTNIGNLNPVAVFIMIGANDYANGVNPATYKANLNTVLDDLQTKCPNATFILIHSYQRMDVITPAYSWDQYRAKLIEIAQERPARAVFQDNSDEFAAQGVPGADPLNLIGADNIHATDAGYALLSNTIVSDLEGIRPIDQWTFTQTSGPAVEIVVNKNTATFISPSVLPPTGPTVGIDVVARKGTVSSAASPVTVRVRPQTVWQGSTGFTLTGTRPPVQATQQVLPGL